MVVWKFVDTFQFLILVFPAEYHTADSNRTQIHESVDRNDMQRLFASIFSARQKKLTKTINFVDVSSIPPNPLQIPSTLSVNVISGDRYIVINT